MKKMKKAIYVLGDIHGNFEVISRWLGTYDIKDSYLIQVGDFGRGFRENEDDRLRGLNKALKKRRTVLYAIRGNHDDPFYFQGEESHNYSHLKLVKDYSVINIEGKNFLFVGGAISIDRKDRKPDVSYWYNEIFVLDKERLQEMKDIDCVITHTCPDFCPPVSWAPIVYDFADRDAGLHRELPEERRLLTDMYHILNTDDNSLEKWYYGHFHNTIRSNQNKTQFQLMGINEFREIRFN